MLEEEAKAQINPSFDMSNDEVGLRRMVPSIDEELCNIAYERGQIGERIRKLEGAIKANPEGVSEKHKRLWKYQLAAMEQYYNVLGDRIRDFVEQTQRGEAEPA